MFRSSRTGVAGPHRPLHCREFIQSSQSFRSGGRRATADGIGGGLATLEREEGKMDEDEVRRRKTVAGWTADAKEDGSIEK